MANVVIEQQRQIERIRKLLGKQVGRLNDRQIGGIIEHTGDEDLALLALSMSPWPSWVLGFDKEGVLRGQSKQV